LGCGTGIYAILGGEKVGKDGKVFAVDIQQDVLVNVRDKAKDAGLSNVETIWADIETEKGTKLADEYVDGVLMSNILFQLEDKGAAIREVYRILKKGGRLMIIDWTDSHGHLGPTPEHVFKQADAKQMLMDSGFVYGDEYDLGDHHYGLVFVKNNE
jgi:ubiquinone/menaquinone biosynthesis C-methylase UbiE